MTKDYLSLFYILLFLSIYTCMLPHKHKRSKLHQSSGRLRGESLNVLLAKNQQYEGEGEGGTHQAAQNERLASVDKYVHQHLP